MRIAFITESYSVGMGYTENMLPRYLAKHGHEVRVFCSNLQIYGNQPEYKDVYEPYLGPAEQPCGELHEDGFVVERLQRFMVGHYIGIRGLKEALLRFHPDVIQTDAVVSVAALQVLMARHALTRQIPVFTECHQHLSIVRPFLREQGWSVRRGVYFLTRTVPGRFVSRDIAHCYAIAPDCEYVAIHHYGMAASKVSVLPLGTDTDTFHPVRDDLDRQERGVLRAKLNVREGDHVAIYTGRLTDGKNPMLLAQAVAASHRSGQPWVGFFVGDGPQKDLISSTDGCHVVGFARHDQLSQYYRAADVAVWPEQESMSMLDAMSSGLPIIVSDEMGDPDRVSETGLTYRHGSVESLAVALSALASAEKRAVLGQRSREIAVERYGWDIIAQKRSRDYAEALTRDVQTGKRCTRSSGRALCGGRPCELVATLNKQNDMLTRDNRFVIGTSLVLSSAFWGVMAGNLVGLEEKKLDSRLHLDACMEWMKCGFEDSNKRGIPIAYIPKLFRKWSEPYVETTGYCIETFLDYSSFTGRSEFERMAVEMADWLVSVQLDSGGMPRNKGHFQIVGSPVVFDSAQDIFGLLKAYDRTGKTVYLESAIGVGRWISGRQEINGSWIDREIMNSARSYYSRVGLALHELFKATDIREFEEAAIQNYDWTLNRIDPDGWPREASFEDGRPTYLHTIMYVLESLLRGSDLLGGQTGVDIVRRDVDLLLRQPEGARAPLAGAYGSGWLGDYSFRCLTGEAQLSNICAMLFGLTQDRCYLEAMLQVNSGLKKIHRVSTGRYGVRGGLQGSYPFWGKYMPFEFPNWGVKFFADALMEEIRFTERSDQPIVAQLEQFSGMEMEGKRDFTQSNGHPPESGPGLGGLSAEMDHVAGSVSYVDREPDASNAGCGS